MEHKVRVVSPDLIMEPLLGLLDETEAVPLIISGNSMTPFLVHGRDTVYLSKPKSPSQKGDMVLYQRINGNFVLHRVLKIEKDSYTMVGDAQTHPEPGIKDHQICAVVTAVCRKGKRLQPGSFWWEFFGKVWIRIVPLRPVFIRVYSSIKRFRFCRGDL